MKILIEYIAKNISKNPKDIEIEEAKEENSIRYLIKAPKEDIGGLIGKQGKIINAIRELTRVKAVKQNKYFEVAVAEK